VSRQVKAASVRPSDAARGRRRLHRRALTVLAVLLALAATGVAAAPASAATAQIGAVTDVSYTSAHVSGEVSTAGLNTSWAFQYSTDGIEWTNGLEENIFEAVQGRSVGGTIRLPSGGTTYLIRLTVFSFSDTPDTAFAPASAPYPEVTTLAVDPPVIVSSDDASGVFSTSAQTTGKVRRPANPAPAFDVSECRFEYISDTAYQVHQSEVQELSVAAGGGSFELIYGGERTSPIAFDASAANVQSALEALPGLPGALAVSGGPGDEAGSSPYLIAFGGPLADRNVDLIGSDGAGLTGGTTAINVFASTQGRSVGFEGAEEKLCEQPPPFTAPEGETPVTAHLAGLTPATTYHLRLLAVNASPQVAAAEAPDTFTTAPRVAAPAVLSTGDPTGVTPNEAGLGGEVQRPAGADPALDTSCHFEYVTDADFALHGFEGAAVAPCAQTEAVPISTTDPKEATTLLGGLKPSTAYHWRLVAENEGGSDTSVAADTLTTLPAELPVVTIDPVAGGTYTTAHVSGTVDVDDPGHPSTQELFQYSSDGGSTWETVEAPTLAGEGIQAVGHDFSGLRPATTYTFRIAATYSPFIYFIAEANGELAISSQESITTEPLAPPSAEGLAVTDIGPTSAVFSATVDPHAPPGPLSELGKQAFATEWIFECTPACADQNENPIKGTVQGEEGAQALQREARRLEPNTHYEVLLHVHSEGGEETLGPVGFDTPLVKPTVETSAGASDGQGGYTLQGVIDPNRSPVTDCRFEWGPNSSSYAFSVPCSPSPGGGSGPVTVEAPLGGLTLGAAYHFRLSATNGAGTEMSADRIFVAEAGPGEGGCPNEALRAEDHSLALPECRAYEMVTPPNKEGFNANLQNFDGGAAVLFESGAGNIDRSGQGILVNVYVATRSPAGWQTIPDLNGASGSFWDEPSDVSLPGEAFYSADLLSSVWEIERHGPEAAYLRGPDGTFTQVGVGEPTGTSNANAGLFGRSADLSHLGFTGGGQGPTVWGPGVYEFLGTGNEAPTRVDVDNLGAPVSSCPIRPGNGLGPIDADGRSMSGDGRVIVFSVAGGCGGANPPAAEVWARIGGSVSVDVSASRCARGPADPCDEPAAGAVFQAATPDGAWVYFTTPRQLLDADTDQSADLYACRLPAGSPAPVGRANPCASLLQVSGAAPGAGAQRLLGASADGSTVLFAAKGVLATNEDALGEAAVQGDENLYVWHTGAADPGGRTSFLGRASPSDLSGPLAHGAQVTPDGSDLVFAASSRLVATDTDRAPDIYRYDLGSASMTRVSAASGGLGGNGEGLEATIVDPGDFNPTTAISADGERIVFATAEALSPEDKNDAPDVYLWSSGRVSLISSGAGGSGSARAWITADGRDIYFETGDPLTPADGDLNADVYDARIGGGFSFAVQAPCAGEGCQPPPAPAAPADAIASQGQGAGNPVPRKACPKGKVRRHGRCVKKKAHKKAHKGKHPGRQAAPGPKGGRK
jgi:hypothetical protein